MTQELAPLWLKFCREIQAISQNGLAFTDNHFDVQRFSRLSEIAAEMTRSVTGVEQGELSDAFGRQIGYATPKIDVRGAVVKDGKILLVQERSDGKWCMPGGWADVGETPAESAVREVREESGFTVAVKKIAGVFDANRDGRPMAFFHAFKIVFLCDLLGGKAQPSDETSAVDFFEFDRLPDLSKNRTHTRHLNEVRKHLLSPGRQTYFE